MVCGLFSVDVKGGLVDGREVKQHLPTCKNIVTLEHWHIGTLAITHNLQNSKDGSSPKHKLPSSDRGAFTVIST
eukprot:467891-Amorphochlora_amoeboformis.AAC.1